MNEFDNLLHEQVAKLAYEIWENKGRPTGTAEEDWLEAEQFFKFGDPEKPPVGAVAVLVGRGAQSAN